MHEVQGLNDLLPQLQAWAASSHFSKNIPSELGDGEDLVNEVAILMQNPAVFATAADALDDSSSDNDDYDDYNDDSMSGMSRGSGKRRKFSAPKTARLSEKQASKKEVAEQQAKLKGLIEAVLKYKAGHNGAYPPEGVTLEATIASPSGGVITASVDGGAWCIETRFNYRNGRFPKTLSTLLSKSFSSDWGVSETTTTMPMPHFPRGRRREELRPLSRFFSLSLSLSLSLSPTAGALAVSAVYIDVRSNADDDV